MVHSLFFIGRVHYGYRRRGRGINVANDATEGRTVSDNRASKSYNPMTQQIIPSEHSTSADTSHFGLFDLDAARNARPVVPLAEAGAIKRSDDTRRSWVVAAIAVSALIGSLTGIGAFSIYQRQQATNANAPRSATLPPSVAVPQPLGESQSVSNLESFTATPPETENRNVSSLNQSGEAAMATGGKRQTDTKATPAVVSANSDRRATENGTAKSGLGVERARTDERGSRQPARNTADATRSAAQNEPSDEQSAERERRATTRRGEMQSPSAPRTAEPPRATPPGYVDDVRRAIGDRPAPARQRRRAREANSDRVREIFEGQAPPRR